MKNYIILYEWGGSIRARSYTAVSLEEAAQQFLQEDAAPRVLLAGFEHPPPDRGTPIYKMREPRKMPIRLGELKKGDIQWTSR